MFTVPELTYDFAALEPSIDARTMEIHHDKHHAAYVAKLNTALETADPQYLKMSIEALLRVYTDLPEELHTAVRNNGGGHANHSLFWSILSPDGGGEPEGELSKRIVAQFGSFGEFKQEFVTVAAAQFGSGWGWLVANSDGELELYATPNQDSPWMRGDTPLLGIDVWEHAYYLQYQNRRPDYLEAIWNVVNWEQVAANYTEAVR